MEEDGAAAAETAAANNLIQSFTTRSPSHIRIKHSLAVSRKIASILRSGAASLHIISDFDRTMTKYYTQDGARSPSSHAVLMRSPNTTPEFKARSDELYHRYYPMEIDPNLDRAIKAKAMETWWTEAHRVIVDAQITTADIANMVRATPVVFRSGCSELVEACTELGIPLLVRS